MASMPYHTLFGLQKEPFSTSPDPDFFYSTKDQEMALTNILIELRLKRGLTVIFGDVGTGKTTLSRKIVQELKKRGDMIFHMILNPSFSGEPQFLSSLIRNFNIDLPPAVDHPQPDLMDLRDAVEKFLIQKSVEEKRTVILIIDEAQKLDLATLEVLRLLLNFETNEHKLIQLILLGQLELYSKVFGMANFWDRISFKYTLNPLGLEETEELIRFRLMKAGHRNGSRLFLHEAVAEIHNYSRGYPRRITMLCHQLLKEMVIQNKSYVNRLLVNSVVLKQQQAERIGFEAYPELSRQKVLIH